MNTSEPEPRDSGAGPALTWTLHAARTDRARLPAVLLIIAVAAGCVGLIFHAWLPALAAVLLLVGATREYLFPITYRLSEQGAAVRGPALQAEIAWREVRRILPASDGIVLSPLPAPSRLDAFRGVSLRFAAAGRPGDRDSALEYLCRHTSVPPPGPARTAREPEPR